MIFHIDLSNHYEQSYYSVLALVSVDMEKGGEDEVIQRGISIEDPVRTKLISKYGDSNVHSALISLIIEGVEKIEKLIICDDVRPYSRIERNLNILVPGLFGRFKSLVELRKEIGDKKLRSAADRLARNINSNYGKRKNVHRRKSYFDDGSVIIIDDSKSDYYLKLVEMLKKISNKV